MTLSPNTQITQENVGAWAGYCRLCATARKVSPCHKCSVPLSPLMADHEEPDLPDIEQIRTLAAEVGYAVGVHGSMERDLDVIAAPWVETAVSAPELAAHLAKGLNAVLLNDKVQDKPCGRWSCCIQIDGWFKHIDLSVAFRPALSPPAEGEGRGDDYEGPDAGMHDTEIDDRDDEDTTPAPAETFEGFNLSNIKRTDAPAVDWAVVGPKLVEALEKIAADGEPYRNGYCQTDIAVDPALTAQEAQDVARDALAAAQPQSNGE